jgi:transcriptional regulator with XRE-family HTH domain
MEKLSARIRRAIAESDLTRYQIAKESGVAAPILSRFMADGDEHRDIRLERTADKLAAYFGLELQPTKKKSRPKEG